MKNMEKIKSILQTILGAALSLLGFLLAAMFALASNSKLESAYFIILGLILVGGGIYSIKKRNNTKLLKFEIIAIVLVPILVVVGFIPSMKTVETVEPETTTVGETTTKPTTTKNETTTKKVTTTKKKTTTKKATTTKKETTTKIVKHKSKSQYVEVTVSSDVKTYKVYKAIGVPLLNDLKCEMTMSAVERFIKASGYEYVEDLTLGAKADLMVYSQPNSKGVRAFVGINFKSSKYIDYIIFGLDNGFESIIDKGPNSTAMKGSDYSIIYSLTSGEKYENMTFEKMLEMLYRCGSMTSDDVYDTLVKDIKVDDNLVNATSGYYNDYSNRKESTSYWYDPLGKTKISAGEVGAYHITETYSYYGDLCKKEYSKVWYRPSGTDKETDIKMSNDDEYSTIYTCKGNCLNVSSTIFEELISTSNDIYIVTDYNSTIIAMVNGDNYRLIYKSSDNSLDYSN